MKKHYISGYVKTSVDPATGEPVTSGPVYPNPETGKYMYIKTNLHTFCSRKVYPRFKDILLVLATTETPDNEICGNCKRERKRARDINEMRRAQEVGRMYRARY